AKYTSDAESAKQLIAFGDSKADPTLKPAELAAWTMIGNLLFNLDEVVTKP
ncbi:MAG: Planctomycete cytochrome, partial [Verrucomicrobiaceae bacterium]|nr:Planctomycete cytochrome [Verrucomicrobiaceae bacterium]